MNFGTIIRVGVFLAVLGFVFSGGEDKKPTPPPDAPPVAKYEGGRQQLHAASRSMDEQDRVNMSMGFDAGADMLDADKRGLVKNTEVGQSYLLALIEFNYGGLAKPSTKYPSVSSELSKIFEETLGTEVVPMSAADRSKLSAELREMAKAVR